MPEPFSTVWVPDREWRVLSLGMERRCRWGAGYHHKACGEPAVAEFQRSRSTWWENLPQGAVPCWWAYCAQHLYGRKLENGVVLVGVAADSEAAKRGYV